MNEQPPKNKVQKTRKERGKRLVTIELDEADYAIATANANGMGMGITAYGRELLLKKRITQRMSPAQREIYAAFCGAMKELSKQGANLNQVAKALNTIAKMPNLSVKIKVEDLNSAMENIACAVGILQAAWSIEESKIHPPKKKT